MYPTNNGQSVARINEVINKSNSGVIVLPPNPSADAIAAATALYLGLSKIGKNLSLACSSVIRSDILGSDKFQQTIATAGDNLVISFPYSDGMIDKVDYNIQGNNFNLIIAPRGGFPKLDPAQVKYSYTGGFIDFIVSVDAPNLNSLGAVYTDNQTQFQGKNLINIDRHITNGFFGSVNYVNKVASSTCELIFKILQGINADVDKDIATNLYNGLAQATNNFTSYSVNAETFETAAQLLKAGATKKPLKSQTRPVGIGTAVPSVFERQATKPIETIETQPQAPEGNQQGQTLPRQAATNAPQDWLKPKIFRGGGLI